MLKKIDLWENLNDKKRDDLLRDLLNYNEDINDLEGLKKEFFKFKELVSQQMSSIGGGGSTKISNMDDVDVSAQQNGFALKYNDYPTWVNFKHINKINRYKHTLNKCLFYI